MTKAKKEGFVLWFTGLPCSGKTTVADKVAQILKKRSIKTERLDGDIVRKSLSSDLGFTKQDRSENIKRVTFVAKLLSRNGVAVIISFVSPYREIREKARQQIDNFMEVFTDCPLKECRRRDVKGMYKLADENKIENFTGVSDPYEKPLNPEITICTHRQTPRESCGKIIKYLEDKGYLGKK